MELLVLVILGFGTWYIWGKFTKKQGSISAIRATYDVPESDVDTAQAWPGRTETQPGNQADDYECNDESSPYNFWISTDGIPRKVDVRLKMIYQKTNGNIHERDYDVQRFQRGRDGYSMYGYCHLRRAARSLVTAGVIKCTDRESGEIIDNLPAYLEAKYAETPDARYDATVEKYWRSMKILFYFAKADGAMRAKERAILVDFILQRMEPGGPSAEGVEKIIKDWCQPTKVEFWDAVRDAAAESKDNLMLLIDLCEKMASTDKKIHDEETKALKYMRGQIAKLDKK